MYSRILLLWLLSSPLILMCSEAPGTVASAAELSDSEAASKFSAVWNADLEGDRAQELRLATALADFSGPAWATTWAKGVLYRLHSVGKPVDLEFTALDGSHCAVHDMRGKVVLINFWATWCAPCVEGMPKLQQLYSRYHSDGLEVIGVSWDSNKDELLRCISKNKLSWPIYFDGTKPGKWGVAFGVGGVPYVLLIDRHGILRYFSADENSAFEAEVPRLIAEQ